MLEKWGAVLEYTSLSDEEYLKKYGKTKEELSNTKLSTAILFQQDSSLKVRQRIPNPYEVGALPTYPATETLERVPEKVTGRNPLLKGSWLRGSHLIMSETKYCNREMLCGMVKVCDNDVVDR